MPIVLDGGGRMVISPERKVLSKQEKPNCPAHHSTVRAAKKRKEKARRLLLLRRLFMVELPKEKSERKMES